MRYIFGGGGKLLYSHFPPYLPRGGGIAIFLGGGGDLLYSHFPAYPGNGGKWLYNTELMLVTNYFIPIFKIMYCFCSRTFV